jgi:hypothetical protein
VKMPLHTSESGAWLYDADSKYLADFTHSKYTCEQIRGNAAAVVSMSHEIETLRAQVARQRAWIDGVMRAPVVGYYVYVAQHDSGYVCETEDEYLDDATNHDAEVTELITRPAPFEDK